MAGMLMLTRMIEDFVRTSKISSREGAFLAGYFRRASPAGHFHFTGGDIDFLKAEIEGMDFIDLDECMTHDDFSRPYRDALTGFLADGLVLAGLEEEELVVAYMIFRAICSRAMAHKEEQ